MKELESRLGYKFKNTELLQTALTHSSYANENKRNGAVCNERLEFLGDAILGVTVAEHLFRTNPDMPEGDMTKRRAELVCEESLRYVADMLGLGSCIRLGRGEEATGGRERSSILADAVEAVIAAVYLDGGDASAIIKRFILEQSGRPVSSRDRKTALQEIVQRESGHVLTYETVGESGPDHHKTFTVHVLLDGKVIGKGEGRSKKEAEQSAAGCALEALGE